MQETYGLNLYQQTDMAFIATLAMGLRQDSRVMMKLAGASYSVETELLALQADLLRWLCWSKTKDGQKGRNRPKPLLARSRATEDMELFDSADAFEKRVEEIRGNGDGR